MNGFGVFLCKLRKEKNMTQLELAKLLGVTNKAVSKWENGEAMPEASLLLPIAEIFNVTVDELLTGRRVEVKAENEVKKEVPEKASDHLFTRAKDDKEETRLDKISGVVCAVVMLCGVAVYLLLGAIGGFWDPYWAIIPACAFTCGIIGIIFNLCDKKKRKQKIEDGNNPYFDGACGLIMLCCLIAYMFCGAFGNLWHPYWIIVAVGGVLAGVLGAIGKVVSLKNTPTKDDEKTEENLKNIDE